MPRQERSRSPLQEQVVTEHVATGCADYPPAVLDASRVVRTLLLRARRRQRARPDRGTRPSPIPLREGHLPSFISGDADTVELPGYDGTVPTGGGCRSSVRPRPESSPPRWLLAKAYARRFPESWPWIRRAHAACMVAVLVGRVTGCQDPGTT